MISPLDYCSVVLFVSTLNCAPPTAPAPASVLLLLLLPMLFFFFFFLQNDYVVFGCLILLWMSVSLSMSLSMSPSMSLSSSFVALDAVLKAIEWGGRWPTTRLLGL
ncbi:hypothetical protein BC939DRAFT_455210 [Gamsiella multidivaricata]|uniref:uncharacterized protein n=1 Tax=Gamsiella multidivaricata TaxID=101098 RepID=UPI00221FBC5E|nr:uncharacterized protein BC939DRAFT_455210 [Gamsiella multidivaricata]KAI7821724.1 hypothetical protein BC939DRAFT_455210 [Gamsiella multidivaricata]